MRVLIKTKTDMVSYTYNTKKRTNQITSRGVLDNVGVCRVVYRSQEYNEFEFDGKDDFALKFLPCVEPALLKFMGVKK